MKINIDILSGRLNNKITADTEAGVFLINGKKKQIDVKDFMNNYPRVFFKAKEEKEVLQGFSWVFDNEISHIKHRKDEKSEWKNEELASCTLPDGSVVEAKVRS